MKHFMRSYKLAETIICLFIPLLLISCNKDKNEIWRSPAKLICDINGEPYIDNPLIFVAPGGKTTPELSYVKRNNYSILNFSSKCIPKNEAGGLAEYSIDYQIFDFSLENIGKKYLVTTVPDKEYLVPIDTRFYYQDHNISHAIIMDWTTGGFCFGNGYIMLTELDNKSKWAKGKIELKVKAPIENKDSVLNIKGEFKALLEEYH